MMRAGNEPSILAAARLHTQELVDQILAQNGWKAHIQWLN